MATSQEPRASFEASATFVLTAVARHGASIEGPISPIWPGLGRDRLKRLSAFLRLHAPNTFQIALRRRVRKDCLKDCGIAPAGTASRTAEWTEFYRDLPSFMKDGPEALAGYAVILCDDGTARAGTL